ncbi:MAG TPA: PilZ domain-containing protein [Polyangiaceae bacterium]|nr:PilZ domain-containing protein [Polyangiaceae bacterium]
MVREKRQHHRGALVAPVVVSAPDGAAFHSTSQDISVGGMYLESEVNPAIGLAVTVSFQLPGLGPVELPGFVRWVKTGGYGVQFGPIGPRETHAIGKIVRGSISGA